MAHLSIALLGPIQISLDGQLIAGFKSNKVRALLAFLSVEADRPHRRERLAGLFWPDWSEREALSNLRYTLSDLRQTIQDHSANPPYLIITRDSLQFNSASDCWLDVAAFNRCAGLERSSPAFVEELEKAASCYRGSFLEGFSVDDSPAFDEWVLLTREQLARQAFTCLHALADNYEERGDWEKAKYFAWQQLELGPWEESAHQQMMRVLSLSGQRSAALAQYESCCRLLDKELGVAPSEETVALYEQIRDGKLKTHRPAAAGEITEAARVPAFFNQEPPHVETPLVVARETELERMNAFLEQAMAGQGGVVFITGEAGCGKTCLIQEFTRRAQEANHELIVASGDCNAYTGIGDPYLPFREVLELLTGDVEARWAAGTIKKDHALRLWGRLPVAVQALAVTGQDLIDTFVQRNALLERARVSAAGEAGWLTDLEKLLERKPLAVLSVAALHQVDLFEQYTRFLLALEQKSPLLLVIDDLQWADAGSINLLFHLGRRIKGKRILMLGAYRSEEVSLGRDGGRNPLEPVVNEFRREYGDILLDVNQIAGRKFIETFLNSEPHRLGPSFREMLYHQTQGHPLFTIELLRGLQERGDITRDAEGYWVEGSNLDWEKLPVRVEAAIQERIGRLPDSLQKALAAASVEGEQFTAEVVSRVRGAEPREILESLSGELDKKHRLVQAQSIQRVDGRSVSRYRFRHILFQKYLYGSLDEVVRVHLHEQVGTALEELYGEQVDSAANAAELARHFEQAKIIKKVIHYLQIAGKRAMLLSAYDEAIAHLSRALNLLESLSESSEREQQELDLLLALGMAWQGSKGAQPIEVEKSYRRARDLCQKIGSPSQMVQMLGGLVILYYVRGEHHKAQELAEEGIALAEKADDPLLTLLCHWYLGIILFCRGNFVNSLEHLEHALAFYDASQHHHALVYLRGSDAGMGAMAYKACCLWVMGYPDQAEELRKKSLALARELGHPFTLADVLCFGGCLLSAMRQEGKELETFADDLMRLSRERNLAGWLATGTRYRGEALALQGRTQEGVAQARQGIKDMHTELMRMYFSGTFASLAWVHINAGNLDKAHSTLDEAFEVVETIDERFWEAELYRLRGEILERQGKQPEAEASLETALQIARRQNARSLELRAAISLGRLWEKQGKGADARRLLGEVYDRFSEGFGTPDLIQAKELLERLS